MISNHKYTMSAVSENYAVLRLNMTVMTGETLGRVDCDVGFRMYSYDMLIIKSHRVGNQSYYITSRVQLLE